MSLRSNKTIDIAFILREKKIKTISATLVQCIKYLEKQCGGYNTKVILLPAVKE